MSRHAVLYFVFLWGALALLVERPRTLVLLFGATAVFALWRASWRMRLAAAGLVGLITWSVVISQGLFHPGGSGEIWLALPWPAAWGGALPVYAEGLGHGLVQSLRFSLPSLLALGLAARPREAHAALQPRGLGLVLSLGLRQLPLLARELLLGWRTARLLGEAPWRARLSQGGPFGPLLGLALGRARRAAEGMATRGLLSVKLPQPPRPPPSPAQRLQQGMLLALGLLVLALFLLRCAAWLHQQGFQPPLWLQRLAAQTFFWL